MKKIIYLLLVVNICVGFVFSQSKLRTKSNKSQTLKQTREKFDPKRNPDIDLQAAIKRASAEKKRIILDVGGEWCGWCIHMDNYFAKQPNLKKLRDKNYIWVKVNFSEENNNAEFLSKYPKIVGYPHLFVLEKDGSLLHSQDTSELETGNSYNLQIFTAFLERWVSPKK